MPSIQAELGATYGQVQWVVAGYVVAFAVALIAMGPGIPLDPANVKTAA